MVESTAAEGSLMMAEDAASGQEWMKNALIVYFLIFVGVLIVLISIAVLSILNYLQIASAAKLFETVQSDRHGENDNRDTLTGLVNRDMFLFIAGKELELSPEVNHALFFIGIDNFGYYERRPDGEAARRLLTELAALLKSFFRDRDVVARIGADEFAVMVIDYHVHNNLKSLAERLNASVAEKFASETEPVKISVGISEYYDDELESLVKRAEEALEIARLDEKNIYSFA